MQPVAANGIEPQVAGPPNTCIRVHVWSAFCSVEAEYASESRPWRDRVSAFHFGPQLGFLFPYRQVGPSWRRLGRIHWLLDVVPRCRGTADLQISWPRPVNSWLGVG